MQNTTTARDNELEALKALANCGAMTSRQIGVWVYAGGSIQTKISRCLRRLERQGLILRREAIRPGSRLIVWVLTRPGAAKVNDDLHRQGYRGWAHHGTDLGLMLSGRHRQTVDYLAMKRREGFAVVGRAGIRAGVVESQEFAECDAVIARQESGDYYTKGIICVDDARASTQARIRRALKKTAVILIGDDRHVRSIRMILGQK